MNAGKRKGSKKMLIDNLFYRLKVQKAYEDYYRGHGQKKPGPDENAATANNYGPQQAGYEPQGARETSRQALGIC